MNTLATSFYAGQYTSQAEGLQYPRVLNDLRAPVTHLSQTSWDLAEDSVLPFLGGEEQNKLQEADHGVCPVHTHGQVINYANALS